MFNSRKTDMWVEVVIGVFNLRKNKHMSGGCDRYVKIKKNKHMGGGCDRYAQFRKNHLGGGCDRYV